MTDPAKLAKLRKITREYMDEPEQVAKLDKIAQILAGKRRASFFRVGDSYKRLVDLD